MSLSCPGMLCGFALLGRVYERGLQEVHRIRAGNMKVHTKFFYNEVQNQWSLSPTALLVSYNRKS